MKPFCHGSTGPTPSRFALLAWLVFMVFGGRPAMMAERYLSVEQAQKLCFPSASRFVEQLIQYTPEERREVGKRIGLPVPNYSNRVILAYDGTNLLGLLVVDHVLGKHEVIDYAVALLPSGVVHQVEVLEYRESHGYEIRTAKWRNQFKGKNSSARLKLHEDIYNLSGATISCRQITGGVRRVLASFEVILRPRLGLPGGLSEFAAPSLH